MNKWKIKKNEEIEDDSDNCELRVEEECTSISKKCNYFLCPRLSRRMLDKYDRELIASYFSLREKISIAGILTATTLYSIQSESITFKTVAIILLLVFIGLWIMSNIRGTSVNLKLKFNYALLIAITTTALIIRSILIKTVPLIQEILGIPTVLVIRIDNVDYPTFILNESALILFSVLFSFCMMFGLAVYAILRTPDEQYIRVWKQEVDKKYN